MTRAERSAELARLERTVKDLEREVLLFCLEHASPDRADRLEVLELMKEK